MAPNEVAMILAKLDKQEERQIETLEKVAALDAKIDAKMSERDRYCGTCRDNNEVEHRNLFDQVRDIMLQLAEKSGVKIGKIQAATDSNNDLTKKLYIIGWAFSAGASLATILAYWPQLKHFFGGG